MRTYSLTALVKLSREIGAVKITSSVPNQELPYKEHHTDHYVTILLTAFTVLTVTSLVTVFSALNRAHMQQKYCKFVIWGGLIFTYMYRLFAMHCLIC